MDYKNLVIETVFTRRSVRSYSDKKVSDEIVQTIIDAARFAPSALNQQPWDFIVLTDPNVIEKISQKIKKIIKFIYRFLPLLKLVKKDLRNPKIVGALNKTVQTQEDTIFYGAPVVIFIVSNKKNRWVLVDCACAAQNMMLVARSLGLGSCFIGRGHLLRDKEINQELGIKSGVNIYATVVFGYPKEETNSLNVPSRKLDNIIYWK